MSIAAAGAHILANGPGQTSPIAWLLRRGAPSGLSRRWPAEDDPRRDARFAASFEAYLDLGGIAREDVVATQMVFSCALGQARLSRWIAERKVLSVEWNGVRWLPIFQFETRGAVPCHTLVTILGEMSSIGDDMAVVEWFHRPNVWLEGRAPAAVLHQDETAVLHAARADCFSF